MTAERAAEAPSKLYSAPLLALSVELARFPLDPEAPLQGHARSRTCGSEIRLSGHAGEGGGLRNPGLMVSACAVGQASAAIFAEAAPGMTREDIARRLSDLEAWLAGKREGDFLPRLEIIEPARAHKGRHGAILLVWRAALDALA
ncbi:iron-sulfur cluster assembly scaffold protein [Qipengyuania nanhaisediminis]|uniref:iron-sulfur cluster assembly scaffold protein n=1 Tax=Qipengyuania nanhaisediminis TaxID=604088 RepID=UPI0038B3E721